MKIKAKNLRDGLPLRDDDELDVVLTIDAFRSNDQGATSSNKDPARAILMQLGEDTLRPKNVKVTSLPALPADQSVNVDQWGGTGTTLGQKTMAASVPVAIASDQASIPVTVGRPTPHNSTVINASTAATGTILTFTAGANGSQVRVLGATANSQDGTGIGATTQITGDSPGGVTAFGPTAANTELRVVGLSIEAAPNASWGSISVFAATVGGKTNAITLGIDY